MSRREKVLVERTAKKYKAIQLIGLTVTACGMSGMFGAMVAESDPLIAVGVGIAILGACIAIAGSGIAWWHHG